MSQAMQQHPAIAMTRHPLFLARANVLKPHLYSHPVAPTGKIQITGTPNHWQATPCGNLEAVYEQALDTGDSLILDFGTHCVGYLRFICRAVGSPPDAPVHLTLTFGETLGEVVEPFSDYQGWLCSSWLQQHHHYLDVLPAHVQLPRRYCFRYLKIDVKAVSRKFHLQFDDITLMTVTSAPPTCPPCMTDDPLLQKIDDVSVLTLRNCMQDVFEDGPKRDRRLWLGDLRLQALVNDVTFRHHALVQRCLYLFAGNTREDGMVSANIFVQPDVIADDTFLFDYSLFFVDVLYQYVQSTNDSETLNALWPVAKRQIDLALERCDARYIVRDSDDWWSFIDWNDALNKQAASQGVLIYCLQRAIWLAQWCGPDCLPSLKQSLTMLKNAALHEFWSKQDGFYTSGAGKQISCASQIWLVLADVGTPEHQTAIMKKLLRHSPKIAMNTPYMRHHFIAALLHVGLREEATTEIKNYWGAMIHHGADTFWEIFDPAHPDYSPYGSTLINSYCHAWSCTPAWFIRQFGL